VQLLRNSRLFVFFALLTTGVSGPMASELDRYVAKIVEADSGPSSPAVDVSTDTDMAYTILDLLSTGDELRETGGNSKILDDVIARTVRAKDIDDIITLNNLADDGQITDDLEKQNNGETDLNDLLGELVSKKVKENGFLRKARGLFSRENVHFVVAIDAGHGGVDPGALGAMGSREKDINLEFARVLGKELRKNRKIRVHLLRHSDNYLSIGERIARARALRVNLLISVHSDSNPNRTVRGLTVYRLAETTLNRRRRKIADSVVSRSGEGGMRYGLLDTLVDMFKNDSFSESVKFASTLARNFRLENINMLSRVPRSANFGILLAHEFPSVLLELGFMSNLSDEMLLRSTEYRKNLAKCIARSIETYFLASR
jgi:N-acetylmuramoyl-L-alanine amidase